MDLALADWMRFVVDGGVLLVPPDGHGRIRVREHQPRVRLATLVDAVMRDVQPGATATLTTPPRPLVTAEGEAAACFTVSLRHGDVEASRTVGVILGDDDFTVVDGRVERPAEQARFAELVEALTRAYPLSLGGDRARRAWYVPPAGWQGVARVRSDVWLAPEHPRAAGLIVVFRARPTALVAGEPARLQARLYEDLTAGFREVGEREPLVTAHGLNGELLHFSGAVDGQARRVADAFLDGGWVRFRLRLTTDEASLERDLATFAGVIESVRPLPEPHRQATPPPSGLLWRD